MATKQIVAYNATLATADDAASAGSLAMRDSSGNLVGAVMQGANLKSTAGLLLGITAKSATFNALVSESTIYEVDSSGGAVTVNLPVAASSTNVVFIIHIKTAGNNVVLDPNGAEQINGASTKTSSTVNNAAIIWCDGAAWYALLNGSWS